MKTSSVSNHVPGNISINASSHAAHGTAEHRPFTTLLMDADGTLLDFDEAERRGVRTVMASQGIQPTDELVARYHTINLSYWQAFERGEIPRHEIFKRRYPHFFAEMGLTVDADSVEALYREQLSSCCSMLPGAIEICTYLQEHYDLYLVTNGVSETQYRRLSESGLDAFFLKIFVSEDAESQKPQVEYFNYCLPRIRETDRSRMLLIGDSLSSDIRGGKNAGIPTCWVNPQQRPAPADCVPDYEVRDLYELKTFL